MSKETVTTTELIAAANALLTELHYGVENKYAVLYEKMERLSVAVREVEHAKV